MTDKKMKPSVLLIFFHLCAFSASDDHPRNKRSINEVDGAEYGSFDVNARSMRKEVSSKF